MNDLPINLFDGAVYLCLAVAVIAGFRSGLLRSLATIFG
jgi:membrane protein required for colicin V production